jgi:uncharacterized protein (TIGR03435 family)
MMRVVAGINFVVLLSGAAFGQSAEALPAFDIADVHASPHISNPNMRGGVLRAGRYELLNASMVDLIRTAYGVDADKVLGGPSWLEWDHFDVIAKAPPGALPETVKLMLRSLLADRFKLVLHSDTHPLPAFALTVGKGGNPKLREADGSGDSGCKYTLLPTAAQASAAAQAAAAQGGGPRITLPTYNYACSRMTMPAYAEAMRTMLAAQTYFGTGIVVDQTGLKGAWDFTFKYTPNLPTGLPANLNIAINGELITIFDAVDKQLGLKLDPITFPTPVLIVDSVNEKPSENPPGVITSLPPPPAAEFEAADLRLSQPGAPPAPGGGFQPSGRVDLHNYPLKSLITLAWNVTSPDMLVGTPKWVDAARVDLVAKMPPPGGLGPGIDLDVFRPALKALLIERFKVAIHTEDRPVDAYTLTAPKPKLKKADPLIRTGCKEGPGADGKDPRGANPINSRLLTCQNVTMAQFAEQLQLRANGYIHAPILDATGLDGAYDFTLNFAAAGAAGIVGGGGRSGDAGLAAGPSPGASDPNGAITLPDAVSKQLGLKLELKKRPIPVLVMDHIEEKPADN